MLQIWHLVMRNPTLSVLRECAVCVFAYYMNWLRESSTMMMKTAKVRIEGNDMTARLSYWKGRKASTEPLVKYSRVYTDVSSALDLFKRWMQSRGDHMHLFAMDAEPETYAKESFTSALLRCLHALCIQAPAEGKYTSHSMRIGSHT